MIDIEIVRKHPERVRQAFEQKGLLEDGLVERLRTVDEDRRSLQTELQQKQADANETAKSIGQLMAQGKQEEAQKRIKRSGELKEEIKEEEERLRGLEEEQRQLLLTLPNLPHDSVPVGASEKENEVTVEHGDKPTFDFEPLPHWELTEKHNLVDFERGAKAAGAGFPFYVGDGARLQRTLVQYFLNHANHNGYREIQPPLLVNEDSARGTGQLPDKEDIMYEVERDELYLIPTAEVPVTNFFRDDILEPEELPVKLCAYTPCFRREAGSHGKDVRGLNRLHQFDKVELVRFTKPSESYDALEEMRSEAEALLQELGLTYRRVLMCTGDMGFAQAKKYDLEVWSPGQETWLEVSSISNFESFQARRAAIRYRPEPEHKPKFVHTLNGSALALPRVVAALLEQYQQEDGSIELPDVLRHTGGPERIG